MIRRPLILFSALIALMSCGCAFAPKYLVSHIRTPDGDAYVYESETGKLTVMRYAADGQFLGSAALP